MLTCKSLFGLGYRGERLIEPSAVVVERVRPTPIVRGWGTLVPSGRERCVVVRPTSFCFQTRALSLEAGRHRQIAGTPRCRRSVPRARRKARSAPS